MKPTIRNDYTKALERVLQSWDQRHMDPPRQDRLIQLAAERQMTVQELQQVVERIDRGYRLLHAHRAPTRAELVDLVLEHIGSR